MVSSLIRLHLHEKSGQYWSINPPYIPFFLLIGTEPEIGLLWAVFQDFILCVSYIDHQRPLTLVFGVCVPSLADKLPCLIVQYLHLVPIIWICWRCWLLHLLGHFWALPRCFCALLWLGIFSRALTLIKADFYLCGFSVRSSFLLMIDLEWFVDLVWVGTVFFLPWLLPILVCVVRWIFRQLWPVAIFLVDDQLWNLLCHLFSCLLRADPLERTLAFVFMHAAFPGLRVRSRKALESRCFQIGEFSLSLRLFGPWRVSDLHIVGLLILNLLFLNHCQQVCYPLVFICGEHTDTLGLLVCIIVLKVRLRVDRFTHFREVWLEKLVLI